MKNKFLALVLILSLAPLSAWAGATMEDIRAQIKEGQSFRAYQNLKPLAESGNPEAQYELAGFYHYGYIGSANFEAARHWYERAAKQGNTDAMIGLAVMDQSGQGAPADKKRAFIWVTIADNYILKTDEREILEHIRDALLKDIPPQEVEAALAEARTFVPKVETP